ncbi:MAG: hypothetical protein V4451_21390, partial [Pseudomonadota bacterium]
AAFHAAFARQQQDVVVVEYFHLIPRLQKTVDVQNVSAWDRTRLCWQATKNRAQLLGPGA